MSTANQLQDYQINPRLKTAALWVSMLFIFVYVDLFSLFRADVRADIEAGKIFAFTIGQGVMLGMIVYVLVPSLMVFLTLVLPVRVTRVANLVLAVLYALTVAGGAIGEWSYYVLGSAVEVVLLAGIAYYAWTWPKAAADAGVARAPCAEPPTSMSCSNEMRDPESVRMAASTAENPDDRAGFDAHVAKVLTSPESTNRAVTVDGRLVGSIARFVVDGDTEVTYWIDGSSWGKRIAGQARALLLESVRVRPVFARAASDNVGIAQGAADCGIRDRRHGGLFRLWTES